MCCMRIAQVYVGIVDNGVSNDFQINVINIEFRISIPTRDSLACKHDFEISHLFKEERKNANKKPYDKSSHFNSVFWKMLLQLKLFA